MYVGFFESRALRYNRVFRMDGMGTGSTHEVTQLLMAWSEGDQTALDRLMPVVHR